MLFEAPPSSRNVVRRQTLLSVTILAWCVGGRGWSRPSYSRFLYDHQVIFLMHSFDYLTQFPDVSAMQVSVEPLTDIYTGKTQES